MPKIKARAKWVDNVRSIVDNSRTHSVVCDLSTAAGGNDSGSTALELALMALAACLPVILPHCNACYFCVGARTSEPLKLPFLRGR